MRCRRRTSAYQFRSSPKPEVYRGSRLGRLGTLHVCVSNMRCRRRRSWHRPRLLRGALQRCGSASLALLFSQVQPPNTFLWLAFCA